MKRRIGTAVWAVVMTAVGGYADSVTHGGTTINMDFVNIGYAGNVADTTGYGAVGYSYRIGTYEVTQAQFAQARAADSRVGDGDEGYWNDGTRTVGVNAPASYVSAYEGMKFANWLTSGDATAGAYQFDASGTTLLGINRSAAVSSYGTVYVLPSEDEWYKAAYFKPGKFQSYWLYANGSDNDADLIQGSANGWNYKTHAGVYVNGAPNYTWEVGTGAMEQNGTYDMLGNVREWNEAAVDGMLDNPAENLVYRGGAYISVLEALRSTARPGAAPGTGNAGLGFRVAAIPEPSSIALIGLFGGGVLLIRRVFAM